MTTSRPDDTLHEGVAGVPWSAAELSDLLVVAPPDRDATAESDLGANPFVRAAAVLSHFNPHTLRPLGLLSRPEQARAKAGLLEASVVVGRRGGEPRWALKEDARRRALRSMAADRAFPDALAANKLPEEPAQRLLTTALRGKPIKVDEQTPADELMTTLQVITWLEGIVTPLPPRDEVRRLAARAQLIRGFRHLVGTHFRGRSDELKRLRKYVGFEPRDNVVQKLGRKIGLVREFSELPPLFVFGPGGVGKSTLLAHFILTDVVTARGFRVPFVYLDFDRPGTLADDPTMLLLEAASQLAVQFPDWSDALNKLRSRWNRDVTQRARELRTPQSSERSIDVVESSSRSLRRRWVHDLADVVSPTLDEHTPLLLFLDTFEEAQARSRAYVAELWDLLEALQARIPRLRTILSGRALLGEEDKATAKRYPVDPLRLGDFDDDAARGFLSFLEVSPDDAEVIVRKLGGNPLTLRLAAEVVKAEHDTAGVAQIRTRRALFFLSLDAAAIQGQLYDRILSHVHDDRVRQLAHPGLVVRRITPDIIRHVLSEPCRVTVHSHADAEDLFEKFQLEVSLVTLEGDGALHHRSDVRKAMLRMMAGNSREVAEQIHREAIRYYSGFEDAVSREQELYHRLAIGDINGLAERWRPDLAEQLASAIDELPAVGQAYLASQLGREIPPELARAADLETWEAATEREVRNLLSLGRPSEAVARLELRDQSTWTPGSRLPALAIHAHARLGRQEAARKIALTSIERAEYEGLGAVVLELTFLLAQVEESFRNGDEAAAGFERAHELALQRGSVDLIWESGLARLAIHHSGLAARTLDVPAARRVLINALRRMPRADWARYTDILRAVAGEVADEDLSAAVEILRVVGTGPVDARPQVAHFYGMLPGELASVRGTPPGARDVHPDEYIDRLLEGDLAQRVATMKELIRQALEDRPIRQPLVRALGAAMRVIGARDTSDVRPAAWGPERFGSRESNYFNPSSEIRQIGRLLESGDFATLLDQIDHSEIVFATFYNQVGALVATVIDSPKRLDELSHLRPHEFFAVRVGDANRGLGFPVRGGRLYPFTQLERAVHARQLPESPFDALVTSSGRPFIGRARLRDFLRNLNEKSSPSVLVVTGPRGSGKSATAMFVREIASHTGEFSVITVDAAHSDTATELAASIGAQMGLEFKTLPEASDTEQPARYLYRLVQWLLGSSRGGKRVYVLVIDGLDEVSQTDVKEFIVLLAQRIHDSGTDHIRLILLGFEPVKLPADIAASAQVEQLHPFTEREIDEYLRQLLVPRGFSTREVERLRASFHSRVRGAGSSAIDGVTELVLNLKSDL